MQRGNSRSTRHHSLNDLVWLAMVKTDFPVLKEPLGLLRTRTSHTMSPKHRDVDAAAMHRTITTNEVLHHTLYIYTVNHENFATF